MFYKTLQWRLVGIFVLVAVFLIIPLFFTMNSQVELFYYNNFRSSIENGFVNFKINRNNSYDDLLNYLEKEKNAMFLFKISEEYKSYAVYSVESGMLLYASGKKFAEDSDLYSYENTESINLVNVMAGAETGKDNAMIKTQFSAFFDYAKSISLSDGEYIIYFRYDREAWADIVENFNRIISLSLVASVIIAMLLGFLLAKTITLPISGIAKKARALAEGNFETALKARSNDEIGQLTNTFNHMARNLRSTLIEISSEKNKIETILNYMTDGVIAFNRQGVIIHANPASKAMLPLDEKSNDFSSMSEMVGMGMTIEDIIDYCINSEKDRQKFMYKTGSISIRIQFALFTGNENTVDGVIAVLQDITEQQKLENMRREFVANVSHELRTPLTSIKSYTESLLDGAMTEPSVSERFLTVIHSETDRMTRLVKDLLQLSQLDNKQMKFNMEHFDMAKLLEHTVDKLSLEAAAKHQVLMFVKPEPVKSNEREKSSEPCKTSDLTKSGESIKTGEPGKAIDLIKTSEPAETGKSIKSGEPFKLSELVKPSEPGKTSDLTKSGESIKTGETGKMSESVVFYGDMGRIEQVMVNLLTNASKYTPEGGRIEAGLFIEKEKLILYVKDNGIGIPEKDLPRIFERFYRVDKARSREMGGTGLGLAIAKEIVEAHQGEIFIESVPEKGTKVTVELPYVIYNNTNVTQY